MDNLNLFFKSVIDVDKSPVVICNLEHEIIYMNPAAIEAYHKRGGKALIGQNLLDCHNEHSCFIIKKVIGWFWENPANNRIFTFHNNKTNVDVYMVALRDGDKLIGYYEKHEPRNPDRERLIEL